MLMRRSAFPTSSSGGRVVPGRGPRYSRTEETKHIYRPATIRQGPRRPLGWTTSTLALPPTTPASPPPSPPLPFTTVTRETKQVLPTPLEPSRDPLLDMEPGLYLEQTLLQRFPHSASLKGLARTKWDKKNQDSTTDPCTYVEWETDHLDEHGRPIHEPSLRAVMIKPTEENKKEAVLQWFDPETLYSFICVNPSVPPSMLHFSLADERVITSIVQARRRAQKDYKRLPLPREMRVRNLEERRQEVDSKLNSDARSSSSSSAFDYDSLYIHESPWEEWGPAYRPLSDYAPLFPSRFSHAPCCPACWIQEEMCQIFPPPPPLWVEEEIELQRVLFDSLFLPHFSISF